MVLPLDRDRFDKPAVLPLVLPVKIIFRVTQIARLTLEIAGSFLPVPQASCLSTPTGLRFRGLLRKQLLRWNYPNGTRPPFTGSHAVAGRARTTLFCKLRRLATVGFWRTCFQVDTDSGDLQLECTS